MKGSVSIPARGYVVAMKVIFIIGSTQASHESLSTDMDDTCVYVYIYIYIEKVQVPDSPSEHTRATIHSQEINKSVEAKGLQSHLSQVKLTKSGLSMTFLTTSGP